MGTQIKNSKWDRGHETDCCTNYCYKQYSERHISVWESNYYAKGVHAVGEMGE